MAWRLPIGLVSTGRCWLTRLRRRPGSAADSAAASAAAGGRRVMRFRRVCRELAAALQDKFGGCFFDVELVERGAPIRVRRPAPFDSFLARPLKKGQRLPAGFFLGFLGPALVFLELFVDLFLGVGVISLAGLSVALKRLDHVVRALAYSRFERLVVDLEFGGELLRRGLILFLLAVDPLAEPQLGLRLSLGAISDERFQIIERDGFFLDEWRLRHDSKVRVILVQLFVVQASRLPRSLQVTACVRKSAGVTPARLVNCGTPACGQSSLH